MVHHGWRSFCVDVPTDGKAVIVGENGGTAHEWGKTNLRVRNVGGKTAWLGGPDVTVAIGYPLKSDEDYLLQDVAQYAVLYAVTEQGEETQLRVLWRDL